MPSRYRTLLPLVALTLTWASTTSAQSSGTTRFREELTQPANPSELQQGRKEHTFQVAAGQLVDVRLDGDGFDTVLQLIPPSGDTLYNDDYLSTRSSRITTIATVGGAWRAVVTALDLASGPYEVTVTLGTPGKTREIQGSITASSDIAAKGHRYNRHSYDLEGPAQLVVQVTSNDFEPEVILHSPSGEVTSEVGDYNTPQVVTVTVPDAEPGRWEIITAASSYADRQQGSYTILIVEAEPEVEPDGDVTRGQLTEASPRQIHGELYAEHRITGSASVGMSIKLVSNEFDAFLSVRSPSGNWYRDDDSGGEGNALVVLPAEAGEWLVVVTTYSPGEMGSYQLIVYR